MPIPLALIAIEQVPPLDFPKEKRRAKSDLELRLTGHMHVTLDTLTSPLESYKSFQQYHLGKKSIHFFKY